MWEHPLLGYYQGQIFMIRGGSKQLREAEANNPCTEDEVSDMADYLEIREDDPPQVREVARMAINAPLPPGWEDVSDEANGEAAFRNTGTGDVVDQHPLDDYFFELVRRRRAEFRKASPPPSQQTINPWLSTQRTLLLPLPIALPLPSPPPPSPLVCPQASSAFFTAEVV